MEISSWNCMHVLKCFKYLKLTPWCVGNFDLMFAIASCQNATIQYIAFSSVNSLILQTTAFIPSKYLITSSTKLPVSWHNNRKQQKIVKCQQYRQNNLCECHKLVPLEATYLINQNLRLTTQPPLSQRQNKPSGWTSMVYMRSELTSRVSLPVHCHLKCYLQFTVLCSSLLFVICSSL